MSSQKDFLAAVESWANVYMFHSLTQFFRFLKRTDLSMLQAYTLTFIFYNEPCKISELCEYMMVSPAAASQMVDRLEKLNMVKRIDEPQDRRVRNLVLSAHGARFVKESIEARQVWLKGIPSKLSEADRKLVTESLQILVSIYEERS